MSPITVLHPGVHNPCCFTFTIISCMSTAFKHMEQGDRRHVQTNALLTPTQQERMPDLA